MKATQLTRIMMVVMIAVSTSFITLPVAIAADNYDLVILNGRVMDPETMFDAVSNVGIKDAKIAKITKKKTKGKQSIIAKGRVQR